MFCLRITANESVPGANGVCHGTCVVAGCTSADTQSPVWLQLRTGYILSSGSLSTVPKRESDDYSLQRARKRERRENREGVNAWTKARLCISGIKDVSSLLFFLILILLHFSSDTLAMSFQRERESCILNNEGTIVQKTLHSSYGMIRRQYLMRSYDGQFWPRKAYPVWLV